MKQTSPTLTLEDHNALKHLKSQLEDLCSDIAAKFNLYDKRGKPRNAFILDTLMRYSCLGCIVKVFTKPPKWKDIDAIYTENHKLAVNLLTERLQHQLNKEGFNALVQDEVEDNYGRVDILIRPINSGVLLRFRESEIIIEVKTGKGLSYAQIFRYLIDKPNATMIVWRIKMRQIFTIDQKRTGQLLQAYMETIIRRATRLLSDNEITPCNHNPADDKQFTIKNPQELIDEFISALIETLPRIVEEVMQVLKSTSPLPRLTSPQKGFEKRRRR